jgi:hypothetical protein
LPPQDAIHKHIQDRARERLARADQAFEQLKERQESAG